MYLVLLSKLPVQEILDFEVVRLADTVGRPFRRLMYTADYWLDTQDYIPA